MEGLPLYILLLVAIAIGWGLGRYGLQSRVRQGRHHTLRQLAGLQGIIEQQDTEAMERFLRSVDVSPDTYELHTMLGSSLRKRGEVERAIRVHQNLLGNPILTAQQHQQAHYELALDYVSAGLLDRAEGLFLTLASGDGELREQSQLKLIELYQEERDWPQAIAMVEALLARGRRRQAGSRRGELQQLLGYFQCELAEQHLKAGDASAARVLLDAALRAHPMSVRASLLLGQLGMAGGDYRAALAALHRVREQDSSLPGETLALLQQAYAGVGDLEGWRRYLEDSYRQQPSTRVLLEWVAAVRALEGGGAAMALLVTETRRRPTLRALLALIDMQLPLAVGSARENLGSLSAVLAQVVEARAPCQCESCGFQGRHWHWLCPACRRWGTFRIHRGADGD